jgi:hypothetical protein
METVIVGATVLSRFVWAFVIQKVALEGLFRIMQTERRASLRPSVHRS